MSGKLPIFMVFDVESVGLHGEGFAVGWVVVQGGAEIASGYEACPDIAAAGSDEDRAWIWANVCPHLDGTTCPTPRHVRDRFWAAWMEQRAAGGVLVADCAWPVEARFLAACIDDDPARLWLGPYPLHDVATARLSQGLDPLATLERLPAELPAHHPAADARQSARLFAEAMGPLALVLA